MLLITAQRMKDAAYDLHIELEIRESYSGRGMFGKVTTGVVVPGLLDIARISAQMVRNIYEDEEEFPHHVFNDLMRDLNNLRWDNMGQQFIIY